MKNTLRQGYPRPASRTSFSALAAHKVAANLHSGNHLTKTAGDWCSKAERVREVFLIKPQTYIQREGS